MISKLKNLFKRPETSPETESTAMWTEISEDQQETMKGGYPWPGFPPVFPPGGGGASGASAGATNWNGGC